MKNQWNRLNHLQLGRYAEYFAKMEFTEFGFEVYTSEVDDHGIDFIIKYKNNKFFEVQVKSIRNMNYVFFHKDKFSIKYETLGVLVTFVDGERPEIFLIPSTVWNTPNSLFVGRDYEGKKSKPEWGINLSIKNRAILDEYKFEKQISNYIKDEK